MSYTDEEKRIKVMKHEAKRKKYFLFFAISLIMVPLSFNLCLNADGILFILGFVLTIVSGIVVLVFKALYTGMLYCPLCGSSFSYGNMMANSMPAVCPHCKENLYY